MLVDTREELSRCIIKLLIRKPFFGHLLSGLTREVSENTQTMGLCLSSDDLRLVVHPHFFTDSLATTEQRVGALEHQALHLVFKHVFERRNPGYRQGVFDLATDLVVNQLIDSDWLPQDAVTLSDFDPPFPPDKTARWYYKRLIAIQHRKEHAPLDDHSGWSERNDKASEALRQALSVEVDRLIIEAHRRTRAEDWLRMPPVIRNLVAMKLSRKAPTVDWRRAIRVFAASSLRTRMVGTQKRPSKRYGADAFSGEVTAQVARVSEGIKVKRYQELAVILDTSGSIQREHFERFFSELHGVWRMGASLTVIETDDQVRRTWVYRGRLPKTVVGAGGTNFDPAFQWLRAQRTRWDGVIFLTDAYVPKPTIRPPCRLLWVVSGGPEDTSHLPWGRVVRVPG